ncbi:hypothetical protein [Microcoleus sp. herbarium14]|uniref:hypothetical protein n=1 Tax=Microcoleus sp. herbarium14 TaxID=3055439 RepID=UPI002FD31521
MNKKDDIEILALAVAALEQRQVALEARFDKPKRKRKQLTCTVNLDTQAFEWVINESERRQISRAQLIRLALSHYEKSVINKGFAKKADSETLEF